MLMVIRYWISNSTSERFSNIPSHTVYSPQFSSFYFNNMGKDGSHWVSWTAEEKAAILSDPKILSLPNRTEGSIKNQRRRLMIDKSYNSPQKKVKFEKVVTPSPKQSHVEKVLAPTKKPSKKVPFLTSPVNNFPNVQSINFGNVFTLRGEKVDKVVVGEFYECKPEIGDMMKEGGETFVGKFVFM